MLLISCIVVILICCISFFSLMTDANASKIPWVAFNGGGSRSGINTEETMISPTTVSKLSLLWSRRLADNTLTWIYGNETIDSSPLFLPDVSLPSGVVVDLLFFNSLLGTLSAVNADTGDTVWENTIRLTGTSACPTHDCITKSTPALDPSGLFVYCFRVDGTVRKYSVSTGTEIQGVGFPVLMTFIPVYEQGSASINIIENILYMTMSGDNNDRSWYVGKVVAVNLTSGVTNVWNALCSNLTFILQEKDCPVEDRNGAGIWSRGSVVDGGGDSIFVSIGNGLFNANTGGFYWGDSLMRLRKGLSINDGPVILDSFTPTTQKYMQDEDYDLGSSSPCILPTIPESITPNMIVQASKDFNLRLINRDDLSGQGCCGKTGGEVDIIPFMDGFIFNHPLAWQDPESGIVWVYVTTTDNEKDDVHPTNTGFHAYQILTDSAGVSTLNLNYSLSLFGSSPFMANGVLFQQAFTALYALDPRTGETLWSSSPTKGLHWQSPIVVNGRVYSSDDGGNIYAWGIPEDASSSNSGGGGGDGFPVWAIATICAGAIVIGILLYYYFSSATKKQRRDDVAYEPLVTDDVSAHRI